MYIKGKAANQIQLYIKDYIQNIVTKGKKADTQKIFQEQTSFSKEIERIFKEVDKEN